jgi:hypothetical protein
MDNVRPPHLSEEDLVRFQDGELPSSQASHLESCPQCATRLRDLENAAALYAEYRDSLRAPSLPPPPRAWQSLDQLIAKDAEGGRFRILRWWPAAVVAIAACIALAVVELPDRSSARAAQLLAQSAGAELPAGRFVSMRMHDRTLVRPAVLNSDSPADRDPDVARVRAAFDRAQYSWRNPLCACSFQAWRKVQRDRRDSVSVVQKSGDRFYRVQTDSPYGVLRSASLILRGQDLRPTGGAFEFEGEGAVEMEETAAPAAPAARKIPPATAGEPVVETPATPADVLHVLAALDEIGADAGEPIEVSGIAANGKVAVHAIGLSSERRRDVAEALAALPRVALDFDTPGRSASTTQPAMPERSSASIPIPLRSRFEERLGGAIVLQETTDRVLDDGASALGRAHAIAVLARHFPPPVEAELAAEDRTLLLTLRQRHIAELNRLAARIRTQLRPLLSASNQAAPVPAGDNWQAQASVLVASAQTLDEALNRLLAGSYSQASGEAMLGNLTSQLQRFESAIEACAH